MFGKVLEWVNSVDNVLENLVENEIDAGASQTLRGHVSDKPALQLLAILFDEFTDQVQDDGAHAVLVNGQVLGVVGQQLSLLLLNRQSDLLGKVWDAALNVPDKDAVERFRQMRDAHF